MDDGLKGILWFMVVGLVAPMAMFLIAMVIMTIPGGCS